MRIDYDLEENDLADRFPIIDKDRKINIKDKKDKKDEKDLEVKWKKFQYFAIPTFEKG